MRGRVSRDCVSSVRALVFRARIGRPGSCLRPAVLPAFDKFCRAVVARAGLSGLQFVPRVA
eukprot:3748707-Lingulodinium_polyedra.AAC.1